MCNIKHPLAPVLLALLLCVLLIAGCTPNTPQPPETTAEPAQNTQEASAPTPEPEHETEEPTDELALPEKVLYGFDGGEIVSPSEPKPEEQPGVYTALRNALEDPANEGAYFAVILRPAVEDRADEGIKAQITSLMTEGPIAERESLRGPFEAELMNDWDRYVYLTETYGADGVEMLFDRDWRGSASEEDRAAYDSAVETVKQLKDECYGEAVREQVRFLQDRGYSVKYEHGAEIFGYLTAGQILDFPADKTCGYYYIDWVPDPSFTAEDLLAALDNRA